MCLIFRAGFVTLIVIDIDKCCIFTCTHFPQSLAGRVQSIRKSGDVSYCLAQDEGMNIL